MNPPETPDAVVAPDDGGEEGAVPERRRAVFVIATAVLVLFAGFAVVLALQLEDGSPDYRGTALLGDAVPALELPLLAADGRIAEADDGATVRLAEREGRVVIVNFFNSWCIPCKEEEPALKEFFAAHRDDDDFEMVGIVRDDTDAAVIAWARSRAIGWTLASDPGARAAVDFGTTGQPETFAISERGTIVALHRGRATIDDLESMLAIARRSS